MVLNLRNGHFKNNFTIAKDRSIRKVLFIPEDKLAHINEPKYHLNEKGEFIITEYNSAKPFSSFFPGVAGKLGIPMWLFYVNRGQCVCSMGIEGKDKPIMEFLPANRAYQLTASQGFRTFIKPLFHDSISYYEPFQKNYSNNEIKRTQKMIIAPARLTLDEENFTLGLKFTVDYFNVPHDKYAGLIRILKIRNMNEDDFMIEGLDGLPLIIPYGINNGSLKFIRRLVEAFVEVSNYETGIPFFRGKVEPADRPEVVYIKKGNFYVGFDDSNGSRLISPIVDPVKIFGSQSDYNYPERFLNDSPEEMHKGQILENRLPCAMGYFKTSISAGKTYTYTSILGHASSGEELNALIPEISNRKYTNLKMAENKELIDELTQKNLICSSETVLDMYARQNFLDNTLRGGFPFTISGNDSKTTLHLYSRKHGDLERDYNDYRLNPTNYSQGNGNFRDVNQNRRNDLLFNPDVQENNVEHFYNLMQLDGFNPLVIKETRFTIKDEQELKNVVTEFLKADKHLKVKEFLQKPFTPGELVSYLRENKISLRGEVEAFIGALLQSCKKTHFTEYGHGFWTDHWTYNLDLLENYLAVYPEKLCYLLFEKKTFSFFDNPYRVQPRAEKYVIWDGKAMQLDAVIFDEEKDEMIKSRISNNNRVHTQFGKGEVYNSSLVNSLLCLIVNKMASLDPEGVGVEMESDKPNWYDALNGLPGLIGSSINETLEIKRHILFLLKSFESLQITNREWQIFSELKEFMETLLDLLQADLSPFEFWNKATSAKESYRKKTIFGISGEEIPISYIVVKDFLNLCLKKLDEGIEKAWNKENNVISTYFISEVTEYDKNEDKFNLNGLQCFQAKKFKHKSLPLFLEGPVHYLRSRPETEKAKSLVRKIRSSGLYDKKLQMYKVNESLNDQPHEIGRTRTFSPGWFENESVWLHMEYKYMLEMLRNKLYEEFYSDFKKVFVPFFDPNIYGRSILENSSFICSSANPDPSLHGNGFVARLSGATAEFIHILLVMTIGEKPFNLTPAGELKLELNPALPSWLFTGETKRIKLILNGKQEELEFPAESFSFMFLGEIMVTYLNESLRDTFGENGVKPDSYEVIDAEGISQFFKADEMKGEIAEKIRDRKIERIIVILK